MKPGYQALHCDCYKKSLDIRHMHDDYKQSGGGGSSLDTRHMHKGCIKQTVKEKKEA